MGYVGNQTTTSFTSMDKQTITGTGASTYTLSHNVSSESEIEVFVNNIRQEGGSGKAYTVSNNQITFSENINSTDDCYVIFQGKAIQTVVPPDGSVTSAKLDTNIAVSGNLDVGTIRATNGTSAMTIDSTGRISTPVRPAFRAHKTDGNVSATNNYVPNVASFNVGSHYSTSTGKFTCPINGVYVFYANILSGLNQSNNDLSLYLNNTSLDDRLVRSRVDNGGNSDARATANIHFVGSFSASDEVFLQVTSGEYFGTDRTWSQFGGYLLG